MYESHWKFDLRPFESVSDPRFYYPSEVHQGALLKLRYAVENRRGAALLVGAAGTGKSLILHELGRQLPDVYSPFVHLVFPQMPPAELLAYLADELGAAVPPIRRNTSEESVRRITERLDELSRIGRTAVVAIDEAHLLTGTDALELVRLLLNFETSTRAGLSLILSGQTPLLPALDRMPHLEERFGVKCLLRPLNVDETISYVSHRITAAGSRSTVFDAAAMERIHQLTRGIPRRINRLCDLALLIGYAEQRSTLDEEHIAAISDELVAIKPE